MYAYERLQAKLAREEAISFHKQYPQYVGYYDGLEWRPVVALRRVKTKLGVAFEPGDVTIARFNEPLPGVIPSGRWLLAWSGRNHANTVVNTRSFRVL